MQVSEYELRKTVRDLRAELADSKAENIVKTNIIRDLLYCRMRGWCDNTCKHFIGGEAFCGLGIDERLREMGL